MARDICPYIQGVSCSRMVELKEGLKRGKIDEKLAVLYNASCRNGGYDCVLRRELSEDRSVGESLLEAEE